MDHWGPEHFNELLKGYLKESLTPQELDLFFELAVRPSNRELIARSFSKDLENPRADLTDDLQKQKAWTSLQSGIKQTKAPVRPMRTALRWVAVIVCLLGISAIYLYNRSKNEMREASVHPVMKAPAWLSPEHTGATLILANGDSVLLTSQDKGMIANQEGVETFQTGAAIYYSGQSESPMYNEIRTSKGKLWRAVLPDQTVVWLNGESSIKYPLQFGKSNRTVEMTGEVYFEVAHHAAYPFLVKTGGMQTEDIGTSFNIKTVDGDMASTATLAEGSARITFHDQAATLTAGQQSVVSPGDNGIRVQTANLTEALAWKNGFFYFHDAALKDVMTQIGDWYQAEVLYKGSPGKELFSGQIDKTLSLTDVLQGLQQPGVKFSLDGPHHITVIHQ